jgi:hypothetical protein
MKNIKSLLHEFHRLQLMIYLVLISYFFLDYVGLGEANGWRYRLHKANTVATGVIIAHFAWSQLIFYWDNRLALANDAVDEAIVHGSNHAIKSAGMMIFRGIFYYAVILSYSSGL